MRGDNYLPNGVFSRLTEEATAKPRCAGDERASRAAAEAARCGTLRHNDNSRNAVAWRNAPCPVGRALQ